MKNNITIFALSSNQELAHSMADILGTEVGKSKVHHFADGEILVEIEESVRGKDVFIVQSTSNPVTENLMEILVLTDALKRASAKEITAVIPYFGYARQDRKAKPRQPITSRLVADLLTTYTTAIAKIPFVRLSAETIASLAFCNIKYPPYLIPNIFLALNVVILATSSISMFFSFAISWAIYTTFAGSFNFPRNG